MKKNIIFILTAMLLLTSNVYGEDVTVKLDNKNIEFTSALPVIVEGRTLIPLRGVFEELGYEIIWEASSKTAVLKRRNDKINVSAGADKFTINGEIRDLDVPAQIINGSMMLPLRAIGEASSLEVNWDSISRTVNLYSYTIFPEIDKIFDNLHYYFFSTSAVDSYIDILESGEYKSPYSTFTVDVNLYHYIILANLAKNLNDYVSTYKPESPYSQDFTEAVNNVFYELNQYYINVAAENEDIDSAKLTDAIDRYNVLKKSLNDKINNELNNYISSVNTISDEITVYKSEINQILNSSALPIINYYDDQEFFDSIEQHVHDLRIKIRSIDNSENTDPYEYALICLLNAVESSVENIKSIKINGSIQNFYDKYNMINSEQEFYSKIISAFFGNKSAKLFN